MSMRGCYRRVLWGELAPQIKNPAGIVDFLYPNNEPADVPEDRVLDIDKTWAAIHFLLTGETPYADEPRTPLGDAVFGGNWLGDVDVGCGPARYLTPAEVRA